MRLCLKSTVAETQSRRVLASAMAAVMLVGTPEVPALASVGALPSSGCANVGQDVDVHRIAERTEGHAVVVERTE